MNISGRMTRLMSILVALSGLYGVTPLVHAEDNGWYVGAGVTGLQTTLDYGYTETYTTTHARLSVGYQFLRFLSVEGRLLSPSKDTDVDFLGDTYSFRTGTAFGIYARPHTNFNSANVYGIIGLTAVDTRYRNVTLSGPEDSDTIFLETVGVGGSFTLARNFYLEIEAQVFAGVAKYNTYFADYVDVYGAAIGAGLRYRF